MVFTPWKANGKIQSLHLSSVVIEIELLGGKGLQNEFSFLLPPNETVIAAICKKRHIDDRTLLILLQKLAAFH